MDFLRVVKVFEDYILNLSLSEFTTNTVVNFVILSDFTTLSSDGSEPRPGPGLAIFLGLEF